MSLKKVVFLNSAKTDLMELRSYLLKSFDQKTWQASYGKIVKSVAAIQAFPEKGRIPAELANLNLAQYRQVVSGMNRIIYEVRGDTAYIHIVCDTHKDFRTLLMRRLLNA